MKIKTDHIKSPKIGSEDELIIPEKSIEENEREITKYVNNARTSLQRLKTELYDIIDAGYSPELSAFLEKAYTVQNYDSNGNAIENREQAYINAGTNFANYCEANKDSITIDQKLVNDAGALVGAINSALSQLNKVEAGMNTADYERVGGEMAVVPHCIQTVIDTANNSMIAEVVPEQSRFQSFLSEIKDIFENINQFVKNLTKSKQEVHQEKFKAIKERYNEMPRGNNKHETKHEDTENHKPMTTKL